MIRGFQTPRPLEPDGANRLQWGPALTSGLIAGAILLVVPRGSPWSGMTFFSPVVLGRSIADSSGLPLLLAWASHLLVSGFYGVVVSWAVSGLVQPQAMVVGGLTGLGLYLLNLAAVSAFFPQLHGNEIGVIFTHIVFGLIAAGAYRGLLRRKSVSDLEAFGH